MTNKVRIPFPEIGAALALWESPTQWYADVVVTGRLYGGDVTHRLVRSAEPSLDNQVRDTELAGKILRNGNWLIRGARGGHGSCVKAMYCDPATEAALAPPWTPPPDPRGSRKARKTGDRSMYDDALPSYAGFNDSGGAVLVPSLVPRTTQPSLNR